jgi:hypothetical protein
MALTLLCQLRLTLGDGPRLSVLAPRADQAAQEHWSETASSDASVVVLPRAPGSVTSRTGQVGGEPADVDQPETDFALFARLSAEVQLGFEDAAADAWEASPFAWIRREPSRRKGAIGEVLVKDWASGENMQVQAASNTEHDCRLDGLLVEVKFSLLWGGGEFVFQQIRDQDYDVACLLGLEPQRVHLWAVPKTALWERATGQHTGAAAQDTKWLRFRAAAPPDWLSEFGGELPAARAALEQARRELGR